VVDNAKNNGCRPNTQAKGQDRRKGKTGILSKAAHCESNIANNTFNMIFPSSFATFLSDLLDSTQLNLRPSVGLFRSHASGDVLCDLLLQVKTQLGVQLLLDDAVSK
jgi:hypothetical protein